MEVFPGWKMRKCCCNWEHKGPPQKEPYLSITALIVASLGGWGSLLPPSLLGWEGAPIPISVFPGGRYHKAFVNCFRCRDTTHSGLFPIIPSIATP